MTTLNDDLTIPEFLRVTTPWQGEHKLRLASAVTTSKRFPLNDADLAAIAEIKNHRQFLEEVRDYRNQQSFARLQQYQVENPELVAMERKVKRDKKRRIAKLGVKATGKVYKKR